MEKVIIIGSGPAGLTGAIYLARANLHPLVIEGDTPGGQLIWTKEVENFPGFDKGILGPELVLKMRKQAEKFGAKFTPEVVKSVDFQQKPFKTITENNLYQSQAVIIATGARPRLLGLPHEDKFLGKGIHVCATCDAAFYQGKQAIVVGGGDSALEEALFLAKFADRVYLIHRHARLRASLVMQNRAKSQSNINFIWNTEIKEYHGQDKLESVSLSNNQTNEVKEMKIDGVFLAVGHIPNTEPFQGQLKLGKNDYIEPKNWVFTEIEGVFVAGDVADWSYQQAITAAGFGCMAALEAERYLQVQEK